MRPPALDLAVLAGLVGDKPATLRTIALRYASTTRDSLAEMEAALTAGQFERIGALGHRLRSASLAVGAAEVAALSLRLERLPEAEPAAAGDLIAQLAALLARVDAQLAEPALATRA